MRTCTVSKSIRAARKFSLKTDEESACTIEFLSEFGGNRMIRIRVETEYFEKVRMRILHPAFGVFHSVDNEVGDADRGDIINVFRMYFIYPEKGGVMVALDHGAYPLGKVPALGEHTSHNSVIHSEQQLFLLKKVRVVWDGFGARGLHSPLFHEETDRVQGELSDIV
jgi:hypothetical protein